MYVHYVCSFFLFFLSDHDAFLHVLFLYVIISVLLSLISGH